MLIGIKSLIIESWKIYKNNFFLFAKIIAWLLIPIFIISILPHLGLTSFVLVPLNFFLSVASAILGIFISVALITTIVHLFKKEKIILKEIFSFSYSKLISCIWVSFLTFLIMFSALLISAIPAILGLLIKSWLPAQNIVMTICFAASGALLIVSTITLAVWLSFSLYVVVLENIKGKAALWRSKSLVSEHFWPVTWRWVVPYIFYMIIILFAIFIFIYLIGLLIGDSGAGFAAASPWWSVLTSNIIYTLAIPLFAAAGVLLYSSLKKEKLSKEKSSSN